MPFEHSQPAFAADDLPRPEDFVSFAPFLKGVFSQWHVTPFELYGVQFNTAEQSMMYAKARLFGDDEAAEAILAATEPAVQKRLGQLVRGFDQDIWDLWKIDIVLDGNRAKFVQNPGAARQLRATAPAMLAEANPRDWIWGTGIGEDQPGAVDPQQWRGTNLLGRILTQIRLELERDTGVS